MAAEMQKFFGTKEADKQISILARKVLIFPEKYDKRDSSELAEVKKLALAIDLKSTKFSPAQFVIASIYVYEEHLGNLVVSEYSRFKDEFDKLTVGGKPSIVHDDFKSAIEQIERANKITPEYYLQGNISLVTKFRQFSIYKEKLPAAANEILHEKLEQFNLTHIGITSPDRIAYDAVKKALSKLILDDMRSKGLEGMAFDNLIEGMVSEVAKNAVSERHGFFL